MLKESNLKAKDNTIKVVNVVKDYIEDMTVEEVLDRFNFNEEPTLKDVSEIYRRMDYLEMVVSKPGHSDYSKYYKNVHGTWVFEY